jgi:YVTN family beta-propeller protein
MTTGGGTPQPLYRVLGPLEVDVGGRTQEPSGEKLRLLLGLLVLSVGQRVSDERLLDVLWPGGPPPTARESLRVHVSRLRKLLGDDAVVRDAGGYVLEADAGCVDWLRFEALVEEARGLQQTDVELAGSLYRSAEALWRGDVACDVEFDRLPAEALRLEALRLVAVEERVDVELAAGRGRELVPELEALVVAHPLRERLQAQLMLALYAGGRQADALAAYRAARERLQADLGIEPGPELREVERRILLHDPDLPGAASARTRRRRQRARRVAPVLAAAAAVVVAAATFTHAGDPQAAATAVRPNSLVELDPATGAVRSVTPLPEGPDAIAVTDDALWVTSVVARTVTRVDRATKEVEVLGGVTAAGDIAASTKGQVWAANLGAGTVTLVNAPGLDFRDPRPALAVGGGAVALDVDAGVLWVTVARGEDGPGAVERLDLERRRHLSTTPVGVFPASVAVSRAEAWVANYRDGTVTIVGSDGRVRKTIRVGRGPITVAADERGIWVGLFWENEVVRIDPVRRTIVARVKVGDGIWGMDVAPGALWVANRDSSSLMRIDTRTNRVAASVSVAAPPYGVAYADGRLWITTQRCGSPVADCAPPAESGSG